MSSPDSSQTNRISAQFFQNPYLLALTMIVVLVAGLSTFLTLSRLEDPRIVHRFPLIITQIPGASAERVEGQVTEPIEQVLKEIAEIKHVESTSRSGISIVAIELKDEVGADDSDPIFSRIRDRLSSVTPRLPDEALDPVFDDLREPIAFTLITGIQAENGELPASILSRRAEELADRLRRITGTDLVRLYGQPQEEIHIRLDPERVSATGLSLNQIAQSLRAADSKRPAGRLHTGENKWVLEVEGAFESLERLESLPLTSGRGVLRLGDIADIERIEFTPAREWGRLDGQRTVFVAARMSPDIRIDQWNEEARTVVEQYRREIAPALKLETFFEQDVYTSARLNELGLNFLMGVVVVLAVVLGLMGWRSALLVGTALPLTVSLTLFGLGMSGYRLHQMSIFGMIIALGLLIDNAIVVVDEVGTRLRRGDSRLQSVTGTVQHLFLPLGSSTLTTVLAFAPILLLPGSAGDFVGAIGASVILAILFSFAMALTVVVALAGRFIPRNASWIGSGFRSARLSRNYAKALQIAFRYPLAAILIATLPSLIGFTLATSLGNEFFPPTDRDMFEIQVTYRGDQSIEQTKDRSATMEKIILEEPQAERVAWLFGGSFPTVYYNLVMDNDGSANFAHAIVKTESSEATKALIPQLQSKLDDAFPDAQVVVRRFAQGPPLEADVAYRIFGPDLEGLIESGERLRLALQAHPDITHTQSTLKFGEPKLWLEADEEQSLLTGMALGDISQQLESGLEGIPGGSIREGIEELPVRLRWEDRARVTPQSVQSLRVWPEGASTWVPLDALGELDLRPEIESLSRYDGRRCQVVLGFTQVDSLPLEVTQETLKRAAIEWPEGYELELGGSAEENANATGNLMRYAPVLLTLMVAALVLSFRSVRIALLLGVVALLAVGHALLATWSISFPVSFNTILGTLGLIGIVLNDSIVVLAGIRENPKARAGDVEGVVEAVLGSTRHVIATTLTTIGGFLPLLIFVGGDFWPSLAVVLSGGIAGGSLMALILVPAAYIWLHRRRSNQTQFAPVMSGLKVIGAIGIWGLTGTGCVSVTPDYESPEPVLPSAYGESHSTSTDQAATTDAPAASSDWWRHFEDPWLMALIEAAIDGNRELRQAQALVNEVRAQRRAVWGEFLPSFEGELAYNKQRVSENGAGGLPELADLGFASLTQEAYSVGLESSWEWDLFSGIDKRVESADAQIRSANAARQQTTLLVIAEVVRAYVDWMEAEERLYVIQENIDQQKRILEVVGAKFEAGLVPEIDVERARGRWAQTRSLAPRFRTQSRRAIHRLASLTGRFPSELPTNASSQRGLNRLTPKRLPEGVPSDLLWRRPDIMVAESDLHAVHADWAAAVSDLYPKIQITAGLGLQSVSSSDLLRASSRAWSLLPSIQLPIFQGGRLRARVEALDARKQRALARFESSLLEAVEEVETALVAYQQDMEARRELEIASASASRSLELAESRYRQGITDFLGVLDAETRRTELDDQLANQKAQCMRRMIGVYQALGGGWEVFESESDEISPDIETTGEP